MSIVKGLILLIVFVYLFYRYKALHRENIRQRDYFIKTLSHDFRVAILAQIRGLDCLKKTINPEYCQNELITEIQNSCNYSLDMISMLMDSYNYDNGIQVLNYEQFNIKDIMQNISNKCSPIALEKNIEIQTKLEFLDLLEADKASFSKLISLLLFTAINYSESNNKIILKSEKKRNFLEVSITYKGKELSDEECRRMFFNNPKFSTVGHGIRMHLCKKIVDFHKGKIWVKNYSNKINSFLFRIPISTKATPQYLNIKTFQPNV